MINRITAFILTLFALVAVRYISRICDMDYETSMIGALVYMEMLRVVKEAKDA
ncbi:MAG: hypothetical protein IKJ45_11655 [Kiritimatiellae bacterium]|nr:hypothetical protein [Kiritimatiellia bacterium]